jgi:hypothetical protein
MAQQVGPALSDPVESLAARSRFDDEGKERGINYGPRSGRSGLRPDICLQPIPVFPLANFSLLQTG